MNLRQLLVCGALLTTVPVIQVQAEQVTPRGSVRSHVNVRDSAGADIGDLLPGEMLPYIGSVPHKHRVQLAGNRVGFVSKRWTDVVPDPVDPAAISNNVVHFLDVGTGDAAIIDMGDREIVIDGGDSIRVLNAYAEHTGVVDGDIELVIVTHGDTDHWKGLRRLLGFDGVATQPHGVREYWDPGYNRDCNPASSGGRQNYLAFVENVRGIVPAGGFKRPLEDFHPPADAAGQPQPFSLPSLPGVTFTVLHSDEAPADGSCSYQINNASIVVKIEIGGVEFLFTGDANGKERDESGPGTPGHVEARLLALNQAHPGVLNAEVLKAPHHGSETASTQAFVDAVDPQFVVVSASTKHHLPRSTVIDRYENGQRVILRTDAHRSNDNDHILCFSHSGALNCNFADLLTE